MKLYVTIVLNDDTSKVYECVDFPSVGSDFFTLYLRNFQRIALKTSTILRYEMSFKP